MEKCYAEISGLVHISHSKTFESCEIFSTVFVFVVVVIWFCSVAVHSKKPNVASLSIFDVQYERVWSAPFLGCLNEPILLTEVSFIRFGLHR